MGHYFLDTQYYVEYAVVTYSKNTLIKGNSTLQSKTGFLIRMELARIRDLQINRIRIRPSKNN